MDAPLTTPWDRLREQDDARPRREMAPRAIVRGLQAGFVATLIMTAFRLPIVRSLPPSANFWARYVGGGEPSDHRLAGLLLHVLYGTSAGAVFGGVFAFLSAERAIEPRTARHPLGCRVRPRTLRVRIAGTTR